MMTNQEVVGLRKLVIAGFLLGGCGTSGAGEPASAGSGSVDGGTGGTVSGSESSPGGAGGTAGSAPDGGTAGAGAGPARGGSAGDGGATGPGGTAGTAGAAGGVDCRANPCEQGEICVPDPGDCSVAFGRCVPASEVNCGSNPVCGCDGRVYGDACEALEQGVRAGPLSACERPAGLQECLDKYCDSTTEACQIVTEVRCMGGCLPSACFEQTTVTYTMCVSAPAHCGQATCSCSGCLPGAVQCELSEVGISFRCLAGCVG